MLSRVGIYGGEERRIGASQYLSVDCVDALSHDHRTKNLNMHPHFVVWSNQYAKRVV